MSTNNLILITAAVLAGTGLSIQHYLESRPVACAQPTKAEHRIETTYGPALFPLVESFAPVNAERVVKVKRKSGSFESRVTKSSRKASAAQCEATVDLKPSKSPAVIAQESAEATIGM